MDGFLEEVIEEMLKLACQMAVGCTGSSEKIDSIKAQIYDKACQMEKQKVDQDAYSPVHKKKKISGGQ